MPFIDKSDIRIMRTIKALCNAMTKCLARCSFKRITVLELCEEAQIGRATFYAHFNDKYLLLKEWLTSLEFDNPLDSSKHTIATTKINNYIRENSTIVKNLMLDADYETLDIMGNFILNVFELGEKPRLDSNTNTYYHDDDDNNIVFNGRAKPKAEQNINKTIIRTFFTGGILSNLIWQINNYFPKNYLPLSPELMTIIRQFNTWEKEQNL